MTIAAQEFPQRFRVRAGLDARTDDPLSWWRFAVPRLRDAVKLFTDPEPVNELVMRGPNKSGKTLTKAAIMLHCLQKRTHIDGIELPRWRGHVEGAQICLDYPQQLLSVKPAYLKLLGRWPHHTRYIGEALSSIHIKPLGCETDDEEQWSVVHFLTQKNRDTGVGVRADVVDFDEPAHMEILRELRKAAHAGRRCIIMHGFTPTRRSQWAPVRADYGDTPRRSIRRVRGKIAEVRWSLDEMSDQVLSAEEKRDLLETYIGDPLHTADASAREHGDYTNTEGSCPFDVPTLLWPLGRCEDPKLETLRITYEATEEGATETVGKVPVEVFVDLERWRASGKTAYIPVDPSSGMDDGKHHKAGVTAVEEGSGRLLARWSGHLAPYSVGVLAASLARQVNDAWIDVEMRDHWGVNVIRGIERGALYGKVCHELRELRPDHFGKEAGWDMDEEAKKIIMGSIQEWLTAIRATMFDAKENRWREGPLPYGECPSRTIIENIIDAELDERDKIVAGDDGLSHGVDMILWGRGLSRAVTRNSRSIPEPVKPPPTPEEVRAADNRRLTRMIQGHDRRNGTPNGEVALAPRRRPRL